MHVYDESGVGESRSFGRTTRHTNKTGLPPGRPQPPANRTLYKPCPRDPFLPGLRIPESWRTEAREGGEPMSDLLKAVRGARLIGELVVNGLLVRHYLLADGRVLETVTR